VIRANKDFVDLAFIVKGSAQNMAGRNKEAISTYRTGIKRFPKNHLLYFNLAFTAYGIRDYRTAEEAATKGLRVNPAHPTSHLVLAHTMLEQGRKIQSLLAFYNFLLLESDGARANATLELLQEVLIQGIDRKDDNQVVLTISDSSTSDEFRAAELMLMLLDVKGIEPDSEPMTDHQRFVEKTGSFFKILGELKEEKSGFWWEFYVPFFDSMNTNGHVEAFCYHIKRSSGDQQFLDWIAQNQTSMDALGRWHSEYRW
jgi:tetratricopeptide (TPR) repeat protein